MEEHEQEINIQKPRWYYVEDIYKKPSHCMKTACLFPAIPIFSNKHQIQRSLCLKNLHKLFVLKVIKN